MKYAFIFIIILLAPNFPFSTAGNQGTEKGWVAPPDADKVSNPLMRSAISATEGKKIYMQICVVCHGDKGKGDGIGGLALNPRPANFSSQKVQVQTDGAIFWKITEGRPPMASYKTILTETQRWQLVNFIRTFNSLKK
ncbi:MAG: cytochrome c [Bacteroidota bacterium]|nr:cytochrome c [Bacteroidota bacterium]